MRALTERQELFAIKYFELSNATQAMIAAGYAPKHAGNNSWNVLKRPLVQARVQELREAAGHDEEIQRAIMNVEERKIRLSEIGRGQGYIRPPWSIQAIDTLNKMDKIYSENPPPNVNNVVVFVIGRGYLEGRTAIQPDKQATG